MTGTRRDLLDALADGPIPPSALADRLDVPEAALADRLDDLRRAGFGIDRGERGYRVTEVPEYGLGVAYRLEAPFRVEHHASVASTNDRARELAAEGDADVVVLADEQTGGRGRRGRSWSAPEGGIWMSLLVRPSLPPERAPLLTLAAAVATVQALPRGLDAAIKWPNDVLAGDGRKLAGVLTESATAGGALEWAVVGVGINANVDADALPEGATSVRGRMGDVPRRAVIQRLLGTFEDLRDDPERTLDAWRARSGTLGRRVRVETADGALEGEAVDVDGAGRLLIEVDGAIERVGAGDCRHLRAA